MVPTHYCNGDRTWKHGETWYTSTLRLSLLQLNNVALHPIQNIFLLSRLFSVISPKSPSPDLFSLCVWTVFMSLMAWYNMQKGQDMGSSGYMTWEKEERRKQSFLPFPRRKHYMLATEEWINMGEDVYTDAVSFSICGKLKQFLQLKMSRT